MAREWSRKFRSESRGRGLLGLTSEEIGSRNCAGVDGVREPGGINRDCAKRNLRLPPDLNFGSQGISFHGGETLRLESDMRTVVFVLAFLFIVWLFVTVATPLLEQVAENLRRLT